MGREQGDNAARVAAIGAGLVLPVEAQVAEIHATISAMLASTHYREAAQRMAAVMSQHDGLATAVKELEALLG